MFYHLWTMKPLEEVQQGATVSMSIRESTIWKIKQGDKYNCETSKQTATAFTISVGVSFDELYKTHAALRKLIQFLKI